MRTVIACSLATLLFLGVLAIVARSSWGSVTDLRAYRLALVVCAGLIATLFAVAGVVIPMQIEYLKNGNGRSLSAPYQEVVNLLRPLALQNPEPELWVGYQPKDDIEAKEFASDIASALRRAGWSAENHGVTSEGGFEGLRLIVYSGSEDLSLEGLFEKRLIVLKEVIQLLREPCQVFLNGGRSDTMVGALIVGPRSRKYPYYGPMTTFSDEKDRFDPT